MTNKFLFTQKKKNYHFTFQTQNVKNVGGKWTDKNLQYEMLLSTTVYLQKKKRKKREREIIPKFK